MVAITLNEYAKGKDVDPATKPYIELYAESSDVLDALPWKTTGGAYQYQQEGTLPGIAYRGINESYTADYSVENPQVEQLFISGGELDVDNFLLRRDPARRAREEAKKIKQLARATTTAFLTGDNSVNPKSPDGLFRRVRGNQIISNNSGAGGGALSLKKLDEALDNTVDPTHIIMNRSMRTWFKAAMRNQTLAGNLMLSKDDFGRDVLSYDGKPFLVGYEAGPDAKILPFTEASSGGGASTSTSLYIVSFKEGHVCGIQGQPMIVKDLGELQSSPVHRTRVEWDNGFCIEHPYAVTRLRDITDAAIVA